MLSLILETTNSPAGSSLRDFVSSTFPSLTQSLQSTNLALVAVATIGVVTITAAVMQQRQRLKDKKSQPASSTRIHMPGVTTATAASSLHDTTLGLEVPAGAVMSINCTHTPTIQLAQTKDACSSSPVALPTAEISPATSTSSSKTTTAVIVVDPISTGANVADAVLRRGVACIAITSGQISNELPVDSTLRTDYLAHVRFDSAHPSHTVERLRALPVTIIGVICGCELGIECTDYLSEQLGLPSNGVAGSEARRNKYLMQEQIRSAGLLAVKQQRASTWEEVIEFTKQDGVSYPLVMKPIKSAGSDHIYKCMKLKEMKEGFDEIISKPNALGEKNESVVVQEFLDGLEYIVDTVSKGGVHKVVAVWEYDKRTHAGHEFVYYGMISIAGTSDVGRILSDYTLKVLDALGIREGAGHAEVIITKNGPCLVEVGARPQGCEGTFMPMANRCWGYNQVDVLVSSITSPVTFDLVPSICGVESEIGFKVDLVCSVEGRLKAIQHLDVIAALPSFLSYDLLPVPGESHLSVTIDCFTGCGSISMVNRDRAQLMRDVEKVRELERTMFVI